jgi:signal peptidase
LGDIDLFGVVLQQALMTGTVVRFRAGGTSMYPTIRDGEVITIALVGPHEVGRGDVVLYRREKRVLAHRVIGLTMRDGHGVFHLRGDAKAGCDAPISADAVVGRVISVCRNGREVSLCGRAARLRHAIRTVGSRAKALVSR